MRKPVLISLVILLILFGVVIGTWATLAIHYSNLPGAWLRTLLAVGYAGALLWAFVSWRRWWPRRRSRRRVLAGVGGSFVSIMIWWAWIPASNDRDWERGVAVLPTATIEGDRVTVRNIRDFDYASTDDFTERYYDKTFRLDAIEGTDFFISYWGDVESIAHTMVSFRFAGGEFLCLSVESRREKGERYSPLRGAFKQYELVYVLGAERDLVRLRTNFRKEHTYLYPSTLTREQSRRLFLSVIRRVNALAARPAFYHTLGRNCTTALVDHMVEVTGVPVSFHRKLLLNGYSDEFAYECGQIPTDMPFAELKRRHLISEVARRLADGPGFSRELRAALPRHGR